MFAVFLFERRNCCKIKIVIFHLQPESIESKLLMTKTNPKVKILSERAKKLRQPKSKEINKHDFWEGLIFLLNEEVYFLSSDFISVVVNVQNIIHLPCTPEFIVGIINIRGRIVSVIDIKRILGLDAGNNPTQKKVIVLGNNEIEFGILVDSVEGNTKIDLQKIQQAHVFEQAQNNRFIKGITEDKTIILETEKLINNEKLIVNEQV